jgi:hypothetical protein
MAGSISLSLSQQFDQHGKVLAGGRLYFIQAGTVATPQNAFQDTDLTIPHPNPITLDAAGRAPAFYLADGVIKVRLESKTGVTQIVQDNLLVIGPSSGGGGGGGGVDPTTIFQTGDVLWSEIAGPRVGWVRDNGRTIGSVTSGATERANSDCQALFVWLWNAYSNTICPVSGGRGANSAADWAANKTIQLPDKRGYIVGGLDDMGNSAAGRFANVPVVSGDTTTPGSVLGEATTVLVTANLPPYTPSGSVSSTFFNGNLSIQRSIATWGPNYSSVAFDGGAIANLPVTGQVSSSFTGNAQGGASTPMANVQKTVLGTFYRKL